MSVNWTGVLEKWLTPTSFLALVGGIIWGIQLNFAVINHTSDLAEQEVKIEAARKVNVEQTIRLSEVAVLLDSLRRNIEQNTRAVENNANRIERKHGNG